MAEPSPSAARRAYRRLRKLAKRTLSHLWLAELRARNRATRSSVLGSAPVIVSLTTYGSRLPTVAYVIESIAAGSSRPAQLILWLDDSADLASLPRSLRRLERRGLQVKVAENYGPHTKYFGALPLAAGSALPIVTADDDVLYPRAWLDRLMRAATEHPGVINCYRASIVGMSEGRLLPYGCWPRCKDTHASVAHFATGVSGVHYPGPMIEALLARGTGFLTTAPRADDIWLHWVALQEGIKVRQISSRPRAFPSLPGTQQQTLVSENLDRGGNDVQIAALYTECDAETLSASLSAVNRPAG